MADPEAPERVNVGFGIDKVKHKIAKAFVRSPEFEEKSIAKLLERYVDEGVDRDLQTGAGQTALKQVIEQEQNTIEYFREMAGDQPS